MAKLLGIRRRINSGYTIIGANRLARALARALESSGDEAVLIDLSPMEVSEAEREGFQTVLGSAHEEGTLLRADTGSRRGVVGLTSSEGLNLIFARKIKKTLRLEQAFVALRNAEVGIQRKQVEEAGARVLFGCSADLELWNHRLRKGSAIPTVWRYEGSERLSSSFYRDADPEFSEAVLLALTVTRGKKTSPAGEDAHLRKGDIVRFLVFAQRETQAQEFLRDRKWASAESTAEAPG